MSEDRGQGGSPELSARQEQFTRWQFGLCLGCGSLILLSFVLLGLTFLQANRRVQSEPPAVEANLQAIVRCQVPAGYRGFRGITVGERRIALLAPKTYGGTKVPLDRSLTISVWTFDANTAADARKQEVDTFWVTKINELMGQRGATVEERETKVVLRGKTYAARERVYTGRVNLRFVVAFVPREAGSGETMALTFLGAKEQFDQAAMDGFLKSIE